MKACSSFAESHLVEPGDKSKARYICSECFQEHGGHFFIRNGRGKELFTCSDLHSEDDKKSLKLISRWVQEISEFGDPQSQKTLVYELSNVLVKYFEEKSSIFQQHEQDSKEHENIECRDEKKNISYLSLCTLFRLKKVRVKNFCDKSWSAGFIKKHSYWCGEALGQALWTSRSEVKSKICDLEKPQNLEQYRDAFPVVIREFFEGFLGHVQKKKWEVIQKKRDQRNLPRKEYDSSRALKISVFLTSVLCSTAFPSIDFWFTHVMSSLMHKPKLLGSLYAILCTANVVSHTQRHERRLERGRRDSTNIDKRLIYGSNMWNICTIDNIDFVEATMHDNLFDTRRQTTRATLRMIFQYMLPEELSMILNTGKEY